jgi:hypothetical protein
VSHEVVTELIGHQPGDLKKVPKGTEVIRVEPVWSRLGLRVVLGALMLCRDDPRVLMA